ncbi:MAG: SurA N-terminal domain-containing protein [Lysobacterales bacterium]
MLQLIRNKASSWFMLLILFVALFALTFFGIGDYFTARIDTHVAKVGDSRIEQGDYEQRYQVWRSNMRLMMGENFDPSILDQPVWREQILQQMVDEAVLRNANERMGLVVPASQLRSVIQNEEAFQVAGHFDPETYRAWLASQRMSAPMFEQRLRDQLAARALPQAVAGSTLVTDAEVDAHLRLSEQTRDARLLRVDARDDEIDENVDEATVQAFYDANQDRFMTEETVMVEYVEVDAAAMEPDFSPSEQDLQERYEREMARFGTLEQRLASHILVQPEGSDADAQRAAVETARELAESARAEGADFAELAREHSADLGSSAQGGDLGWLERGLTEPAFDEALFEMAQGAISDPVRTEEGYHVIWLREVRPAQVRAFEDVRDQLLDETVASERERLYNERAGRLTDMVYADPGALHSAAESLDLEVRSAGPFTRNSMHGIFATPAVRQAAFSDLVLSEGDVSEAISLDANRMLMLRVTEHKRPEARPLAEVADQIRAEIVRQRHQDALKAWAEALFARWQAGEDLDSLAADLETQVETVAGITRMASVPEQAVVAELFGLPRPQGQNPVQELLAINDIYVLAELQAVADGDPATVAQARRDQVREELAQSLMQAEQEGLLASLRRGEKIEMSGGSAGGSSFGD